jgi:magnesium-transporting ATPase (P-type)
MAFLLSFLIDFMVWKVAKADEGPDEAAKTLFVLSSGWPLLVFHSHTFSNCLESALLATIITIIYYLTCRFPTGVKDRQLFRFFLGTIYAFGIFTRFTFIIFSAPIILFLAYSDFGPYFSLHGFWRRMCNLFLKNIFTVFGFSVMFFVSVIIDSIYFGELQFQISSTDSQF